MKLINKSKISQEALQYILKIINESNSLQLKYIKLSETKNRSLSFYGKLRCPKEKSWHIVASVHSNWKYPTKDLIVIGTEKISSASYKYITKEITFNNYDEAMMYVFFHEWFHFLRRTNQISIILFGKNTECSANKYSLTYLKKYANK